MISHYCLKTVGPIKAEKLLDDIKKNIPYYYASALLFDG
jgi:hypothetical protein